MAQRRNGSMAQWHNGLIIMGMVKKLDLPLRLLASEPLRHF
jgi:hypothetical protein